MFSNAITIKMQGGQGNQDIQIPSNYMQQYPFITIINMTDNSISIYPPHITEPTAGLALYTWGAYQSMTVPIIPSIQNGFSIVWTNPHATNTELLKTAQILFSANSLGFNQSFAPSFAMGGNVLYTALVSQQAGLALESKQDDMITALGSIATQNNDDIITALAGISQESKQDDIITALAGISQESKQDDIITALGLQATAAKQDDIAAALANQATAAKQDDIITALGLQATAAKQDDIAAALGLQATVAKQDDIITALGLQATAAKQDDIVAALTGKATEATLEAVRAALVAGGLPSSTLETTHHDASTANGTGTVANVTGYGPIAFQAVGTWDGATVTYQGSVDGTNYVALPGTSAVTADGIFQPVDPGVAGYKSVRAEITNAGATTSLTVSSLAVAIAKPTSADVIAIGKNAEGVSVTANPLTIGYKDASGNATGVSPTNALPVQLSGSKVTVKRINLTSSTEIAATNGTETIAVVVPAGKIWTVQVLRINANTITGATGNHRLRIVLQDSNLPLLDTLGQAATKSIAYMYGQFVDVTAGYSGYTDLTGVLPSDKNSQLDGIKGLKMVAGHTLNIVYINYSDKPQTETRTIYLSVIEEDIVV